MAKEKIPSRSFKVTITGWDLNINAEQVKRLLVNYFQTAQIKVRKLK